MPAGRRILLIVWATAGADVHKVHEVIEDFVIFQTKKNEKISHLEF